jgi:DedD protein
MDRQLLERMIGAVVLIALLVIVAPALLDGDRDADTVPGAAPTAGVDPEPADTGLRQHTIRLNEEPDGPPMARERTPEPVTPAKPPVAATTQAPAAPTPDAAPPKAEPMAQPAPAPKKPEPEPTKPAPVEPPAPVPTEGWAVQLGSFSQRDNAQRLAAEVADKGFATFLMPLEKDGATLYRVRVGPRPDRAAADKLAAKLAIAGYMGRTVPQGQEN